MKNKKTNERINRIEALLAILFHKISGNLELYGFKYDEIEKAYKCVNGARSCRKDQR